MQSSIHLFFTLKIRKFFFLFFVRHVNRLNDTCFFLCSSLLKNFSFCSSLLFFGFHARIHIKWYGILLERCPIDIPILVFTLPFYSFSEELSIFENKILGQTFFPTITTGNNFVFHIGNFFY